MPRVPRAERQVETSLGPRVRFTADAPIEAFGGGQAAANVSRAAGQLAQAGQQIYEQEKQKANDAWSTDYYAKLAAKKQELVWDPKGGLITKQGKDSFTAPEDYGKQFDSFADSLEADATEEQKAMARRIRQKERIEFDGQIMRHVSQESQKFQDNSVKAGIEVAKNDAVLNYADSEAVEQKIGLQEALYMQTATGKPPALVELERKNLRSSTQRAVIERMIDNGQDVNAKAYFENVKGQLSGADIDDVEKNLAAGTLAGESQRRSDQIFASSGSLSGALEQARKIEEPKLRDETTRRVKDLFATKKVADSEREERLSIQAYNILDQSSDTDKIPRSMWNSFTGSQRSALISYARSKREGRDINTNWESYYDLKTMASSQATKNDFLRLNLMDYRDKLGNAEFKEVLSLQSSLRTGDGKADKTLDGYRSNTDIVMTSLREAGIDANAKAGSEEAQQVALFKREVDRRVIAKQQQTGKAISNLEMQEVVDGLMTQGVTEKGWFWDTQKRVFELKPGESFDLEIDQVPPADRAKIEEALKGRGIAVTEDRIVNLYARKVMGGNRASN